MNTKYFEERWPEEFRKLEDEGCRLSTPYGASSYAAGMMLARRLDSLRRELDADSDDRALMRETAELLLTIGSALLP